MVTHPRVSPTVSAVTTALAEWQPAPVSTLMAWDGLTRRRVISAGGAVALSFGLRGARAQTPGATSGAWSYTDAVGTTVTLPARPERVIAMITPGAALWDFGVRPVGIFAWEAMMKPDGYDPAWGSIDASAVTNVSGGEAGNLDPEEALTLAPDLIVTTTFDDGDAKYIQIDPALAGQLDAIAPLVAVYGRDRADRNVVKIAALAELLGADLQSPENVAAKAAFDATVAEFTDIVAAKPDLRVMVISPAPETFSLTAPADFDDLSWFAALGLNLVGADLPPDTFWQEVSAELAPTYPADVILVNSIAGVMTIEELTAHPAYGQHPAIKAGQIGEWNQSYIPSYQDLTRALRRVLDAIRDAEPLTNA